VILVVACTGSIVLAIIVAPTAVLTLAAIIYILARARPTILLAVLIVQAVAVIAARIALAGTGHVFALGIGLAIGGGDALAVTGGHPAAPAGAAVAAATGHAGASATVVHIRAIARWRDVAGIG
jgi:hypothetical protein